MNILIDTSIWSLALRRRKGEAALSPEEYILVRSLKELIDEGRASIIGPIRQEILSGISSTIQFKKLRDFLQPFEDIPLASMDYERAAEFFNLCRLKGIQGSHTDFIICAAAKRYDVPIFTSDADFMLYARHCDLRLYQPAGIPPSGAPFVLPPIGGTQAGRMQSAEKTNRR